MFKSYGIILFAVLAVLAVCGGASPAHAVTVIAQGYRADEGGGGALVTGWTTGNLGNTWDEGEWVPYKVAYFQMAPGLSGLDSIVISYEFLGGLTVEKSRFIDLVRGIQVGTADLDDTHGWVGPDGDALPVTNRDEVEAAQNHTPENVWTGFELLNLPYEQVNRTLSGGEDEPPGEEWHTFKIFKSDLLAAGIGMDDTTVVIYFQLHESRTFVWDNQLQEGYAASPTSDWGGYLYGLGDWPDAAPILGSGYVSGSSGMLEVVTLPGGNEIPIPIPQAAPGRVSGSKWRDDDADGDWGLFEQSISGWQIHICGELEGLDFVASDLTGILGPYSFDDLSSGMSWFVKEDTDRLDPPTTGYGQTFPNIGAVEGIGTGVAVTSPPSGIEPVGWEVEITRTSYTQSNLDFGNAPMAGLKAGEQDISFALAGPNPAGEGTVMIYGVQRPGRVSLSVWSVGGELVRTLVDSEIEPGQHRVTWDGRTDSGRMAEPGIYFCRLKTADVVRAVKVVRTR